jgi:hypothetical protein
MSHSALLQTADVDGDGAISLEDFRSMLDPAVVNARKASLVALSPSNGAGGASSKAGMGMSTKAPSFSSKSPALGGAEASTKLRR